MVVQVLCLVEEDGGREGKSRTRGMERSWYWTGMRREDESDLLEHDARARAIV